MVYGVYCTWSRSYKVHDTPRVGLIEICCGGARGGELAQNHKSKGAPGDQLTESSAARGRSGKNKDGETVKVLRHADWIEAWQR